MLTVIERAAAVAVTRSPWTRGYGLARTLLALGTAATLAANPPDLLFPGAADLGAQRCGGVFRFGLFCVAGFDRAELARWGAVAVLAVVASGWRPRWTALPHWWVSSSVFTGVTVADGGDQVAAVLTLLLLPVALLDGRRWHWHRSGAGGDATRRLVAHSALAAIRLQVAFVYFHAAVGKFGVAEWANGTALYYWIGNPTAGAPPWLADALLPLLVNGLVVAALTWGVLLLELALGLSPLLPAWTRRPLLVGGIALHAGIAVVLGLPSFTLAMVGALLLLLDVRILGRLAIPAEPAAIEAWTPDPMAAPA